MGVTIAYRTKCMLVEKKKSLKSEKLKTIRRNFLWTMAGHSNLLLTVCPWGNDIWMTKLWEWVLMLAKKKQTCLRCHSLSENSSWSLLFKTVLAIPLCLCTGYNPVLGTKVALQSLSSLCEWNTLIENSLDMKNCFMKQNSKKLWSCLLPLFFSYIVPLSSV